MLVLRKSDIDLTKRAGELTKDEVEGVITILQNPLPYKIPDWFMNRQKDVNNGKSSQVLANHLDNRVCDIWSNVKYWGPTEGCATSGILTSKSAHQDAGCRGQTRGLSKMN
ncbi:small ribosomal subunit protein uS13-like [Tenrec ecaudatus]|uniref:small ribosomal subunit protein uS13-like n=1 Tax=Tenrec ecaudatus TaxID=94439 RepID=UPI003F590888